jgi:hypothetical protein
MKTYTDEQIENVIIPALPHGSGIDAKWTHRVLKNGNVELYCSFHGKMRMEMDGTRQLLSCYPV